VLLGAWQAGAVVVPVDPADDRLSELVARCGAHTLVRDAAALVSGPTPDDVRPVRRAMSDAALVVWTSGTTGVPKGVTLTFGNISYDVAAAVSMQNLSPTDRWLSVLPLHHMLELTCALLSSLASGAEVSFAATLLPRELAQLMLERQTTHMMTVPLLLRLLRPAIASSGLRPRALFVGGAPVATATLASYAELGVAVYQGYGLTETSPLVAANSPRRIASAPSGVRCPARRYASVAAANCRCARRR
jgi:long-subunit acyl-CoA synthetase (AMP-forming)